MGTLLERLCRQRRIRRREFLGGSITLAAIKLTGCSPNDETETNNQDQGESQPTALKASWLSHHTYIAPDLSQTKDWYQAVFGMQLGYEDANQAHLWFGDEGGDTLMILRQAEAGEAAPRIERFGFTIDNWDRIEIEKNLEQRGLQPQSDTDNGFWFMDPDGNEIGVFSKDYLTRPSTPEGEPQLWKALSANHVVVTSRDYRGLGDWYLNLFDLRETSDGGRDVYQWFGDSVWIPTATAEGEQTSFELKSLDHVAYTIENYNSEEVHAELTRREMKPDDNPESLGINCIDINGFKTQVCDKSLVPDAEQRRA